jgi:hypothetical protein
MAAKSSAIGLRRSFSHFQSFRLKMSSNLPENRFCSFRYSWPGWTQLRESFSFKLFADAAAGKERPWAGQMCVGMLIEGEMVRDNFLCVGFTTTRVMIYHF